jgi:hypothetical protein
MDPRELQKLALKLIASANPAEVRTAISRAYYATYHVGAEALEEMGFIIEKGPQGHKGVQHRLHNSGDPEISNVGSKLGDLETRRIDADYHLNDANVERQKTAEALVKMADNLIQKLDKLRSAPNRGKVILEIRKWERIVGKGF